MGLREKLGAAVTPIQVAFFGSNLLHHEDQQYASWILRGLTEGFRIGFRRNGAALASSRTNMLSAMTHKDVVTSYLSKEMQAGRIVCVGPVEKAPELKVHISPFGVIPKKGRANCWRLILDLSSPDGKSVNDGICKEWCSLQYLSMSEVVDKVLSKGPSALLGKMDIKQAYRNIPVAAQDSRLLGMQWEGKLYVDRVLPFGLRSAPIIFSAVADALQWIMCQKGASWVGHYLDDFVTIGPAGSDECQRNMTIMERACEDAGVPIEHAKTVGPVSTITFLGMELDTKAGVIRLPQDKLNNLQELLQIWRGKKTCLKRDLQSIVGLLNHACKAVRSGRAFLRRMIDLLAVRRGPDDDVRLNVEARSDIEWWHQFSKSWNGVAMLSSLNRQSPAGTITSDASGNWGCGAVCGTQWFQLSWNGQLCHSHITVKELTPVVISVAIWGHQWTGKTVLVRSDNMATVDILNNGTSRNSEAMHLVRCLAFILARLQLSVLAEHIPGIHNTLADALSRNNLPTFRSLFPQADDHPIHIAEALVDLLITSRPDWTSQYWTNLWNNIFPPG